MLRPGLCVLLTWLPLVLAGCLHPSLERRPGEEATPATGPGSPTCLAFSPDGAMLAVGLATGEGGAIRLLDPGTLAPSREFTFPFPVYEVCFSHACRRVMAGGPNHPYGCQWIDLEGRPVTAPAFRPPGVQSADLRAMAAKAGRKSSELLVEVCPLGSDQPWGPVHVHGEGGDVIALATEHGPFAFHAAGRVHLHSLVHDEAPVVLPACETCRVRQLAFSADGKFLVAVGPKAFSKSDEAVVWSVAERRIVREFLLPRGTSGWKVSLSPDGRHLLAVGDTEASVWDVTTGEQRFPDAKFRHAAFSPDGGRLAVLTTSGEVTVLRLH